jgi:hypothetical protein
VPVASVDAIAANEPIETRFDCGNRINGFDQNPDLNHVAGFTVVGLGGEAGGDNDSGLILVDYKAVQREPPLKSAIMDSRFCSL